MDNEYLKRIYGLLESGATLGTGAVSGLVGLPYGLYKGVTSGAYGTPEAPRIAAREAQQFMERNTYQPRTAEGQANLQQLAGLLEASKLPPVMPEASLLAAIPKQAYAAQAERAGMAAEKAIEPAVRRTMERGGLPAQLLGDLSQDSVRPVVLMHGGKTPVTTVDPEKLIQSVQSSGFHTTNKAYTPFSFATGQNKSEGIVSAFDFPDELYARTLNYDKPISQSQYVMDAVSDLVKNDESLRQKMISEVKNSYKAAKESGLDVNAEDVMTGKQFHSLLRRHYGGLKEADTALENAGITGASWQYSAKRPDEIATAIYPKYAEQLKAIGQYQASPDDLQGITKNINKDIGLLGQAKSAEPTDLLSYRGSHTAPGPDYGAPLYDLTGGGQMYPADVYSPKAAQYYGTGYPKADKEAFALANKVRGNPDAEVTMYRAVPKNESIKDINAGDWVTLSKDYAKTHGESVLDNDYKILSKKVKAKDLWTNADSIHEFGYWPE